MGSPLVVALGGYTPARWGATIDERTRTLIRRLSGTSRDGQTWDPASRSVEEADTADLPTCGRFVLVAEIGRGGMGRVFEAVDPQLGRVVAVKVRLRRGPADGGRFLAEARVTAQLEHPGVVPVHELGVDDQGAPFYAMRRIGGRSLREVLDAVESGDAEARRAFGTFRLLAIFVQVCRTIAYAHDRGVLHADLKPQNVMVGDFGEVLVLDWGLARPIAEAFADLGLQVPAIGVGTPGYMSPEQASGEPLDARSDVWSLGSMLFEIVAGVRPYDGDTPARQLQQTLSGPPPDPRERAPGRRIAPDLAAIVLRAMRAGPGDRFASALDLAEEVEAWLEGTRRREEAQRALDEGRAALDELAAQREAAAALQARLEDLSATVPTWAPLAERLPLADLRDALGELDRRHAETLAQVVACGERALERDPDHPHAHRLLADTHGSALLEAEARGDERGIALHGARLRVHDDGAWARLLDAPAVIALQTDPPARVTLRTYATRGLVWALGPPIPLGTTPLEVAVPPGSHQLMLEAEGLDPVPYPVSVRRGERWEAAGVRIPRPGEVPPGMVYVPPGPAWLGEGTVGPHRVARRHVDGFSMAVHPVTAAEYVAFLDDIGEEARFPRLGPLLYFGPGWKPPAPDHHGDVWDPRWPVFAISYDDACAYAAWRSARDGFRYALPSGDEWEKAARGADGRVFPWGDTFDPALCLCEGSHRERSLPGPVGAYATDVSPYGVRDLAGTMREWTSDLAYEGGALRVIRGGAWNASEKPCRAASRRPAEPFLTASYLGFRLVHRG